MNLEKRTYKPSAYLGQVIKNHPRMMESMQAKMDAHHAKCIKRYGKYLGYIVSYMTW